MTELVDAMTLRLNNGKAVDYTTNMPKSLGMSARDFIDSVDTARIAIPSGRKRPKVAPTAPVAEPVAEPVAKPVAEPVAKPIAKPVEKKNDLSIFKTLPIDIVNNILDLAGFVSVNDAQKNIPLDISELFSLGGNQFIARGNSILMLLEAIARGKEGNEKIFFEGLASVLPREDYFAYKKTEPLNSILNTLNSNRTIKPDLSDEAKMIIDLFGNRATFPIEAPTSAQQNKMTQLFGDKLEFDLRRRKGTMGLKSGVVLNWTPITEGINKRTKAGKEEVNKIYSDTALLATEYIQVINKNIKQIMNLSKDVTEKEQKDLIVKKEAVREEAKKSVEISKTAKKAIAYPPSMFTTVLEAFFGDKEKALEKAEELKRKFPGKNIKFYGRKNLTSEPVD